MRVRCNVIGMVRFTPLVRQLPVVGVMKMAKAVFRFQPVQANHRLTELWLAPVQVQRQVRRLALLARHPRRVWRAQ